MFSNSDLLVLLFLVFISPGLALLVYGLFDKEKSLQNEDWRRTTGIITSRKIDKDLENPNSFYPIITYSYEVDGQSFVHSSTHSGNPPTCTSKKEAEDYLANFPIGKKVLVYYNLENPQDSVLSKTPSVKNLIIFMGLTILLSCGSFVLYWIAKRIMPLDLPLLK